MKTYKTKYRDIKINMKSKLIKLGVFRKILLMSTEPIKLVTKGANLEKIRKLRISIFLWLYKFVLSSINMN